MESFQSYNEKELLEALRSGDEAAFTTLYRLYSPRIYYNILALVKNESIAEELVQDIFARIWRRRESISIEKTITAYLFTVSRNRVYDFFKEVKRDQDLYASLSAAASEHYSYIEEALFARENMALLQKAIASLPPQRRRAFELCKMEGLSYRQASEEMGVSLSTLKDHMASALAAIRQYVSKNREVALELILFFIFNV